MIHTVSKTHKTITCTISIISIIQYIHLHVSLLPVCNACVNCTVMARQAYRD